MKPDLDNIKEYTSKVSLTKEEKLVMLQNIQKHANVHPTRSRYAIFMKYSVAYASMLALIIGTTATSIAAEGSLPGDTLYSFKTTINEGVAKTLAFSDIKKARVHVELVDKRMGELEKMIVTNKDTPEKIDIIIEKLGEHKEDIQELTDQARVDSTEDIQAETTAIYATLESVIDTHRDILVGITQNDPSHTDFDAKIKSITIINTSTIEDSGEKEESEQVTIEKATSTEIKEKKKEVKDTNEKATSTEEEKEETNIMDKITNFGENLEPIIKSIKDKSDEEEKEKAKKIREEMRKRVIENAEKDLQIQFEEKIDLEII